MRLNWSLFALVCLMSCNFLLESGAVYAQDDSEQATDESSSESISETPVSRKHLLPEAIEQTALADESIKKQIVWLDSPEGVEGANVEFLGLEQLGQAAEAHGAVLLLHGVEQHPNWPQVIRPLRMVLPEDGWYTLSVMLPYENYVSPPARELSTKVNDSVLSVEGVSRFSGRAPGAEEPLDEKQGGSSGDANPDGEGGVDGKSDAADAEEEPTETAEDLDKLDAAASEELIDISSADKSKAESAPLTFDQKVQLRIDAAYSKLLEQGYQNIVLIGYQQGAQGVLDYLAENKRALPDKGLTVIWIDARFDPEQSALVGELLGDDFTILLLDIVDSTSFEERTDAKTRIGVAKRKGYDGYTQVRLLIADMAGEKVSAMNQRIRGWLKVSAPGEKVTDVDAPQ